MRIDFSLHRESCCTVYACKLPNTRSSCSTGCHQNRLHDRAVLVLFQVVFTGVVRKILECFFTQYELKYLDDILPSMKRKKALQEKENEKNKEKETVSVERRVVNRNIKVY